MWTEKYKITHQLFHEKNETAEILRNLSKDKLDKIDKIYYEPYDPWPSLFI